MKSLRLVALLLSAWAVSSALAEVKGLPEWAQEACRRSTPAEVRASPAVVLLRETRVEADDRGTSTRSHRIVLRILAKKGSVWATAMAPYLQGSSRVRTASAWLVRQGQVVRQVRQRDWLDASVDTLGTLYNETRYKLATFADETVENDLFVAETEITTPVLFAEDEYIWGIGGLPVVSEAFSLRAPSGCTVESHLFGTPQPVETADSARRTVRWQLDDQPYFPPEPSAPLFEAIRPRLLCRFRPVAPTRSFKPVVVTRWSELARWTQELNRAQCDRSPEMGAIAQRLTSSAATEFEKLSALCRYVQGLRYASVVRGLTKGLGFQPNKASRVLAVGYGDCKDKANLLCALLREVGVESFLAAARVYDDVTVQPDFPSPSQFNHAIVAIRVGEDVRAPAVVETAAGRLLFFDPTAEHTNLGDLPYALQGTRVFLQKDGVDALVSLPRIAVAEGHRISRSATLQIGANGAVGGNVSIVATGQAGAALREAVHRLPAATALETVAREQLGESMRLAALKNFVRNDDAHADRFSLTLSIEAGIYAQPLQNSMHVLRADVFARGGIPALTSPVRSLPVKMPALSLVDEVEFVLPPEMKLDETPADVTVASPYGNCDKVWTNAGATTRMIRRLELIPQQVPASENEALRNFLSAVIKADSGTLILRKVEPFASAAR